MSSLGGAQPQMGSTALISAMITPAILILASGSLVTSTLQRLSRVVDRSRFLIERLQEAMRNGDEEHVTLYRTLLRRYRRRNALVERALAAYYLAIGLFVTSCLAIAFDNVMRDRVPWLAPTFTVSGSVILLLGTLAIFLETSLAIGVMRTELELSERLNSPGQSAH